MIRTTIRLDDELYKELRKKAIDERVSFTKLVNHELSLSLNKKEADHPLKKMTGTEFLLKLTTYGLKGPKDLATNHDKYTWE